MSQEKLPTKSFKLQSKPTGKRP